MKKPWAVVEFLFGILLIWGVIGPGFLNQGSSGLRPRPLNYRLEKLRLVTSREIGATGRVLGAPSPDLSWPRTSSLYFSRISCTLGS